MYNHSNTYKLKIVQVSSYKWQVYFLYTYIVLAPLPLLIVWYCVDTQHLREDLKKFNYIVDIQLYSSEVMKALV